MPHIPLDQQIREVKRELGYRARVYPNLVSRGKLTQVAADGNVARMEAVLATLEEVARQRNPVLPLNGGAVERKQSL